MKNLYFLNFKYIFINTICIMLLQGHLALASPCDYIDTMLDDHPSYLSAFNNYHNVLMSGPGPLPEATRHYIALIVSYYILLQPGIGGMIP